MEFALNAMTVLASKVCDEGYTIREAIIALTQGVVVHINAEVMGQHVTCDREGDICRRTAVIIAILEFGLS